MYDPSTNQWTNLLTENHKITKFMKDDVVTDSDAKGGTNEGKKEGEKKEEKQEKGTASVACQCKREDDSNSQCDEDEDTDDWSDCDSEGVSESDRRREKKEIGSLFPKNALVVDGNECFRVVYTAVKIRGTLPKEYWVQPVVHQLKLNLRGKSPSAKIGEQQDQKLIPIVGDGAFQLRNKVYVNMKGCVHDTGIKITPGQKKKVDTGVWKKLQDQGEVFEDLTVASFSFDKKTVFCKECLKGQNCKEEPPFDLPDMPTASETEDAIDYLFADMIAKSMEESSN